MIGTFWYLTCSTQASAKKYAQGGPERGRDSHAVDRFVDNLISDYYTIVQQWKDQATKATEASTVPVFHNRIGNPLTYWRNRFTAKDMRDFVSLKTFAVKVLSCSPNGSMVERSFSDFGRIITKTRNRIQKIKSKKLIFSKWNKKQSMSKRVAQQQFYDSIVASENIMLDYIRQVQKVANTDSEYDRLRSGLNINLDERTESERNDVEHGTV